jgi:hypothetical protein
MISHKDISTTSSLRTTNNGLLSILTSFTIKSQLWTQLQMVLNSQVSMWVNTWSTRLSDTSINNQRSSSLSSRTSHSSLTRTSLLLILKRVLSKLETDSDRNTILTRQPLLSSLTQAMRNKRLNSVLKMFVRVSRSSSLSIHHPLHCHQRLHPLRTT